MNATRAKACLGLSGLLLFTTALSSSGVDSFSMPVRFPGESNPHFLYVVNSISSTVLGFAINPGTGALTAIDPAVPADDGSIYAAATPNGRFLYVANGDLDSSSVSAYRINPRTGVLAPTSPAAFPITGDNQPFGIAVDPSSTHVYTANTASISAFRIDQVTGALSNVPGTPVATGNVEPQDLALTPNGKILYVTYGLTNQVAAYALNDQGLPVPMMGTPVTTGDFPEGIVVEPGGRFAYVVNWLSDDVSGYKVTPETGLLVPLGTTSLGQGCEPQELAVNPSGKFLYVTCPGFSNIAQFAINPQNGSLTPVQSPLSAGLAAEPRGIAVDPSGRFVYSAFNGPNRIGVAEIGLTGALKLTPATQETMNGPLGVAIANPR
jgi:6-phosphogluconolactonase